MKKSDWFPFLKTLRRLPDDVVLDMATREFDMDSSAHCLCGWAVRAALSRANGKTPEEFDHSTTASESAKKFGGSFDEWDALYMGVTEKCREVACPVCGPLPGHLPEIEMAFVERIAEACR